MVELTKAQDFESIQEGKRQEYMTKILPANVDTLINKFNRSLVNGYMNNKYVRIDCARYIDHEKATEEEMIIFSQCLSNAGWHVKWEDLWRGKAYPTKPESFLDKVKKLLW